MIRRLFLLTLILFFYHISLAFSQIAIDQVAPGPYTPGSSIAATFTIDPTACITPGNRFDLYLVRPDGTEVPTPIGSYNGFYSTFVNGTIPDNPPPTPGPGYKLRIKSTNPVLTSNDSGPFEITAGTAINAQVDSRRLNAADPSAFGFCTPRSSNAELIFENQSTTGGTVTAQIKNELSQAQTSLSFVTPLQSFTPGLAHYTMLVKILMPNGSIATRAYFIINNPTNIAFQTTTTGLVCLPEGTLVYGVDTSNNGVGLNFPGNLYRVSWGDNLVDYYTLCQLKSGVVVEHKYTTSSCGRNYNDGNTTHYNVFGVNISMESPLCGAIGSPLSTFAKVIHITENRFSGPEYGCINTPYTFDNNSITGENPSSNTPSCEDPDVRYNWYLNGNLVAANRLRSQPYIFPATSTPGLYTIQLTSTGGSACPSVPVTRTICIQAPPRPAFDITSGTTGCAPFTVSVRDQSVLDLGCSPSSAYTYNWIVTDANGVGFTNFTDGIPNPQFNFTAPGVYTIALEISSGSCTAVRTTAPDPIVIINGPAVATLSLDRKLCALGIYRFDNAPGTVTTTILTGTQVTLPDTYTWQVTDINDSPLTSADYSFEEGTGPNTKYPSINFKRNTAYKITVTHKNTCTPLGVTDSQILEFFPAPEINAGSDQTICFTQNSVQLNATNTGVITNQRWVGGLGTFGDRMNPNTTYIPTDQEKTNGLVVLNFTADTQLDDPCSTITDEVRITIKKEILITSSPIKSICTDTKVNYAPTSNLQGTSYTWTVTGSPNASGYANSTGPGIIIEDRLINTDPLNNATVTYTITPINDNCSNESFTLTVTITPKPVLTATLARPVICSGGQTGISLSSSLAAPTVTYYTWTSSVVAGITGNTEQITPVAVISINEILTSTATTTKSVTYIITPQLLDGCPGTPVEVVINILPPVTGNTVTGEAAICSESMPAQLIGSALTGGDGLFFYQWQSSPDGNIWTDILNANGQNYQPGILTETTYYRRGVSTEACSGTQQNMSAAVKVTVNPDAKAEYTYGGTLRSCAPFALPITAVLYPDRNDTYTWVINANGNISQSSGPVFPGYTIQNPNERVTVKLVVTSSLGCATSEFSQEFTTTQKNAPSFTPVTTVNCGPTTISFVNTSVQNGDESFKWDFGNGETSNFATPAAITFNPSPSGKDTTYVITLYAITSCGTDSVKGSVLIKSEPRPVFSPSETSVCSPALITFTNNSPLQSGTQYSFDFGDGSPILVTNDRSSVTHIYRATATTQRFNATMTAVNSCGTKTTEPYIIEVRPNNVNAELVVNGNQKRGCAPFKVTFDNNSTGADEFSVDFNDGTQPRQSILSPERFDYTFTRAGIYRVMLVAISHNCGRDTTYEEIEVLTQPMPTFEADITQGCTGLQVQFKNTTQETNVTGFIWDFGDGTPTFTGVEPPVHTYTGDQEYYTVTLTASNALGCSNTEVKTEYIHVIPPPIALFNVDPSTQISIPNYTFKFIDQSLNNPDQWIWDFGDGSGSSERNPSHTYLDTGLYKVTLKVINQNGCFSSTEKLVRITGVPGYLFVPNSFIPGSESNELRTFNAKGSGIETWRMSIFNKWGQLLWETTKLEDGRPAEGWDGTFKGSPLPQSVYYWKIDVRFVNGSEWKGMAYENSLPKRTGAIHLIR